jgi:eukaryotic-like serine/threonine-protein kinase
LAKLGKYELVRPIATGGMAEVFLAKTEGPMGFAKTVVVKRIRPHLLDDPTFVEMFLGEAKLAAQLNHPNIVQIFDFGEADGAYYIAMEYVDGPNLRALAARASAARQPLPLAVVAKIVSYACEGLAYAHDFVSPETGQPLNIVHRDISPDNIVVAQSGAVKVVDFGIAKAAEQLHQTRSGLRKGKLAYMSPEYLKGKQPDRRADVFALGVVLYELLANKKPYDAESEVTLMHAMIYEDMVPIRARRPDIPADLEAIVEKTLRRDRDDRYPSCRELQADLERFVITQGEPLSANHVARLIANLPMTEKEASTAARTPSRPSKPLAAFSTPAGQTPAGQKTPAKRASGEQQRPVTPAKQAAQEDGSVASTVHMTAEELEAQVAAIASGGGRAVSVPVKADAPPDATMRLTEDMLPLKKNIGRRLEPSVMVSPELSQEALKPPPRRAAPTPPPPPAPLPSTPPPSTISNRTVILVVVIAALSLLVAATAVVLRLRG